MYDTICINSAADFGATAPRPSLAREIAGVGRRLRASAHLIWQLTLRDALGRYQGSHLGVAWSLLNPLGLLAIESVVFGLIFQARFTPYPSEGPMDYALALFAGLLVFNVFAEALTRSPSLVVTQPNYVTKVVFPLEILSINIVLSAMLNMCISLLPLCAGLLLLRGHIAWTLLVWPALLPPLFCFCLGISWLLSATGVFFRDLNASVVVLLNIVMYGSAIFYPINKVPPALMPLVKYNPIAWFVEQSRNLAVWGVLPDPRLYGSLLLFSIGVMLAGYFVFSRARRGFADVL